MNTDGIDVENLPELKISAETFEALTEINGDVMPAAVNGATWKRRINPGAGTFEFVICRYVGKRMGDPLTIQMLRPVITGSIGNNPGGHRRPKR